MGIRFGIPTMLALFASLAACQMSPPRPPEPTLPAPWSCLRFPNGADKAGAVLRTVDQSTATRLGIDNLVQAFPPARPTGDYYGFADFSQDVSDGMSAAAVVNAFQRLGVALNVKGNATYAMSVSASGNTIFVANDNIRQATLQKLNQDEGRIPGAHYYFVKEALGSSDLSYEAKTDIGVSGSINLAAKKSSLSANVNVVNGQSKVSSRRELIACAILEPFSFTVVHGANGEISIATAAVPKTLTNSRVRHVLESAALPP